MDIPENLILAKGNKPVRVHVWIDYAEVVFGEFGLVVLLGTELKAAARSLFLGARQVEQDYLGVSLKFLVEIVLLEVVYHAHVINVVSAGTLNLIPLSLVFRPFFRHICPHTPRYICA